MTQSNDIIKFALADDHPVFRQGLRIILGQYEDFEFVCEAENGEQLLAQLEGNAIDIVLLDISMPVLNGLDTAKKIDELFPKTRVLILSMHNEEPMIAHAMKNGAHGYILKNSEPETMAEAMRSIIKNGYYYNDVVNPEVLKKLIAQELQPVKSNPAKDLNDRELTVLKMICDQKTSAEIADSIFLSIRTVEGIRTTLMDKLAVKNIAGLVAFAYKNGIV